MKITKIEAQKKNDERVNIYIDDEFAFGISLELVYTHSLKKGMEVDTDFLNNVVLAEEQIKANNVALRFLGYRQRSEKEIRNRLYKEDFDEDIIENTIDYLNKNKLIDDFQFAESFMKDKINLSNHGPQKIRYDLYQKGIDKSIIDEVLELDNSEYDRCLEAAEKKIYSYRNDDYQKKYRKLSGFLQRRGFSFSVIKDVLNEVLEK